MKLRPPALVQLDSCGPYRRWYTCTGRDLQRALKYSKSTKGGPARWLVVVLDVYGDRLAREPSLTLGDIADELSEALAQDAGPAGVA